MLVFPDRTTTNWQIIPTTTLLTSSYVSSVAVSTDEANILTLDFIYTKGDETSIQFIIYSTNDANPTIAASKWYQQVTASSTAGTTTLTPNVYSVTAASVASVQNFSILVNPVKATAYYITYKSTGGTPTGTLSCQAYIGWV